jgi:spermidine synthase
VRAVEHDRVRVVKRGRRRELRVDGTFASSWRPGEATTGSVWDALALPILALPPVRRRRALVLGLGGGSAARLLRALAPTIEIVGVEYDAEVLRAARRHFDLDALGVEVVRGDAREYLASSRRRFDLVIDDVFVGRGPEVHKPDWLPEPGLARAAARLASGGLLVSNTLDEHREVAGWLRPRFPAVVRIRIEDYDNRVLVAGPAGLDARRLRAAAAAEPRLAGVLPKLGFLTLPARRRRRA